MKIKKVLYTDEEKYYWKSGELHTSSGSIKEEDIKTKPKVKSNRNKLLTVIPANFLDNFEKIKRGPQTMTLKDMGEIIIRANINKNSNVLEIGTGSGALTCVLSQIANSVVSYEIREDHFKIAEKNIKELEIENVKLINKDASQGIEEKDFDAAVIDIKEPWLVINEVEKAVKSGSYIVSYSPSINQTDLLIKEALKNQNVIIIKTIEVIEREWDTKKMHPKMRMLGHTAFLTFIRKI